MLHDFIIPRVVPLCLIIQLKLTDASELQNIKYQVLLQPVHQQHSGGLLHYYLIFNV